MCTYDTATYAYLKLILSKHLPLCAAESKVFRAISKYNFSISVEKFTAIIFELVLLVEKKVQDEMRDCRGSVLYDSCTCNNMHFTTIMASYCTTTNVQIRNNCKVDSVPRRTLLALSPMEKIDVDTDDSNNETTTFNAESYINFMKETFDLFECSFEEWCVFWIGDNVSTNKRVSNITRKPHVGCSSHKLNLEVKDMLEKSPDLFSTANSVQITMR